MLHQEGKISLIMLMLHQEGKQVDAKETKGNQPSNH